jgi:quinol-cytochrome oxidoreductase complex cytochrome b subunit
MSFSFFNFKNNFMQPFCQSNILVGTRIAAVRFKSSWVSIQNSTIGSLVNNHLGDYPTPKTITYFWGLGSLAGVFLAIQIATGLFLSFHYAPHVTIAFDAMEHIMRDVNYGWLIRFGHCNGASFFFVAVYTHMGRAFYYNSFLLPRQHLWMSGVTIFLLMMATAFMGYVLPWGQMSFWGATVITNLFSAIPIIGDDIASWLWGGFSVDNPTLNRFFGLHFMLPFVILGLVGVHLMFLHEKGSLDSVVGNSSVQDRLSFFPYFVVKDVVGVVFGLYIFLFFVFFSPDTLGHPDNYIEGNALATPAHIVPEWYFLPFYAMLRSIPDKLGGVVCMGAAIVFLYFLPQKAPSSYMYHSSHSFLWKCFVGSFIANFLALGWLGSQSVEPLFVLLGQLTTFYYFFVIFFFVVGFPKCSNLKQIDVNLAQVDKTGGQTQSNISYNFFSVVIFFFFDLTFLLTIDFFLLVFFCYVFYFLYIVEIYELFCL